MLGGGRLGCAVWQRRTRARCDVRRVARSAATLHVLCLPNNLADKCRIDSRLMRWVDGNVLENIRNFRNQGKDGFF